MENLSDVFVSASNRLAGKRDRHALTKKMVEEGTVRLLDAERLPKRVDRLLRTPLSKKALDKRGVADELQGLSGVDQLSLRAQGELERIIGGADFFPAWFLSRGAEVRRTVARVRARTAGGKEASGTGFLVGPRLLLTNFHVLDWTDQGGPSLAQIVRHTLVEFDYEEQYDGTMQALSTFGTDPDALLLFSPWQQLDYVLVALSPVSREGDGRAEAFGFNRLTADLGKIVLGEAVYVIQHPRGQPKQIVLQNNRLVDRDEATDLPYLTYEADTDGGSSGSPVFNRQWEVVALHHAREIQRDEQGKILARDGGPWDPQTGPEGIKYGDLNEGVRVSRIVEDLEAKLTALREEPPGRIGEGEVCSGEGARLLEAALRTRHNVSPSVLVGPTPAERLTPTRRGGKGSFPPHD